MKHLHPHRLSLGLRFIVHCNSNHIPPFDTVGNKNLRLLVSGQKGGMERTAYERSVTFYSFFKKTFECLLTLLNIFANPRRRIAGAELRAGAP